MTNIIKIDTVVLTDCSERLKRVKVRVAMIDKELNSLNKEFDLLTLLGFNYNKLQRYNYILNENCNYLTSLVTDINNVVNSLNKLDPLNYRPPKNIGDYLYDAYKKAYDYGAGFVKTTCATVSCIKELVSESGPLYKPWKITCTIGKMTGSIASIVAAMTVGVASYGTSSPVSYVVIIFALNELANSSTDLADLLLSDGSKVGKHNYLKEQMAEGGRILGSELLNNEEIGETISDGIYDFGNNFKKIADVEKSIDFLAENEVNGKKAINGVKSYLTTDTDFSTNTILTSGGKNPVEWVWKAGKKGVDNLIKENDKLSSAEVGKNVYDLFKNANALTKSALNFVK